MRDIKRLTTDIKKHIETIFNSFIYDLLDKAYKKLPVLLCERYEIEVKGRLVRKYVTIGRKHIQVSIYGRGRKNGKDILILGDCKVKPSKREIIRFEKYATKIGEQEGLEVFPLVVAHDFPPSIEKFLKEKAIAYFWSYEIEE